MKKLMVAGLCASAMICTPALAQKKIEARPAPKPGVAKPAPTKVRSLPDFTFKQAKAGETMEPGAVGKCAPASDGIEGKLQCSGSDPIVAGIRLTLAPSYYFYQGRLTSMLFLYDNDGTNYLTLLGAFRERYGVPCDTSTEKWQNKAGSTFDNATATWCFRTGKLKLEQMGPSMKYGIAMYSDDYTEPSKAVPKDF